MDTASTLALKVEITRLQNEVRRWRQRAERDALTGCLRREALMDLIEQRRTMGWLPRRCTVALVDADHFKKVNDTHGHAAGDRVLQVLAETLQSTAPAGSMVARLGGEEFALILPMPIEPAREHLERARQAIEQSNPTVPSSRGEQTLRFTVSLGASNWDSDRPLGTALALADERLYLAKNLGRNRMAA